jgi:hypothetical protein
MIISTEAKPDRRRLGRCFSTLKRSAIACSCGLPPPILLAAAVCFVRGIVLPLIHVDRLFFFPGMIASLWAEGDRLLGAVIALYSVAFPALTLRSAAQGGLWPSWCQ